MYIHIYYSIYTTYVAYMSINIYVYECICKNVYIPLLWCLGCHSRHKKPILVREEQFLAN